MVSNFVAHGAAAYDHYMGRWSRRLAPLFLDFAGSAAGERVVDVGCGTGSLSLALVGRSAVKVVEAIDFEADFVDALQEKIGRHPITARRGDACSLPFADDSFDRALSLLVLHFVSDARQAIRGLLAAAADGTGQSGAVRRWPCGADPRRRDRGGARRLSLRQAGWTAQLRECRLGGTRGRAGLGGWEDTAGTSHGDRSIER